MSINSIEYASKFSGFKESTYSSTLPLKTSDILSSYINDKDNFIESIKKGIDAVINNGYDSSFAAKKLQDFLWKDGVPFNYDLDNIPRTQDLPPLYEETIGFYIYKNNIINDLNRRIGNNPYIVEVSAIESVDIDEAEDFMIADAIFNHFYKPLEN